MQQKQYSEEDFSYKSLHTMEQKAEISKLSMTPEVT